MPSMPIRPPPWCRIFSDRYIKAHKHRIVRKNWGQTEHFPSSHQEKRKTVPSVPSFPASMEETRKRQPFHGIL
jgi:hypothetical protein